MTGLRSLDAEIAARAREMPPPGADPRGRVRRAPPHLRPAPLRFGTRGSPLALWQARHFLSVVAGFCPVLREEDGMLEEVVVATSGDRIQDRRLADVGGKGLFGRGPLRRGWSRVGSALGPAAADAAAGRTGGAPTVAARRRVLCGRGPRAAVPTRTTCGHRGPPPLAPARSAASLRCWGCGGEPAAAGRSFLERPREETNACGDWW